MGAARGAVDAIGLVVSSQVACTCFAIARSCELGACKPLPRDDGAIVERIPLYDSNAKNAR